MVIAAQGFWIELKPSWEVVTSYPNGQFYGTISTATGQPIAEQFGDDKVVLVESLLQTVRGY